MLGSTGTFHQSRVGPMPNSIVNIIEADGLARGSLWAALTSEGYRVREYATAREFLSEKPYPGPSCVVLNPEIPEISGLQIQEQLAASGRIDQLVFVAREGNLPLCVRAMKAGAIDFLSRPISSESLLGAVEQAISRSSQLREERAKRVVAKMRFNSLTLREQSVLTLILEGLPNREIGSRLGVAEGTVKIHRRRVMKKMLAYSIVELVLIAQRAGLPIQQNQTLPPFIPPGVPWSGEKSPSAVSTASN